MTEDEYLKSIVDRILADAQSGQPTTPCATEGHYNDAALSQIEFTSDEPSDPTMARLVEQIKVENSKPQLYDDKARIDDIKRKLDELEANQPGPDASVKEISSFVDALAEVQDVSDELMKKYPATYVEKKPSLEKFESNHYWLRKDKIAEIHHNEDGSVGYTFPDEPAISKGIGNKDQSLTSRIQRYFTLGPDAGKAKSEISKTEDTNIFKALIEAAKNRADLPMEPLTGEKLDALIQTLKESDPPPVPREFRGFSGYSGYSGPKFTPDDESDVEKLKRVVRDYDSALKNGTAITVHEIGTKDRPATAEDIADMQEQLRQVCNDPNTTIVSHSYYPTVPSDDPDSPVEYGETAPVISPEAIEAARKAYEARTDTNIVDEVMDQIERDEISRKIDAALRGGNSDPDSDFEML